LEETGVGVLVEPDDPHRLAEALVQVLRDPARARALGVQAQAVAQARYDDARMITQVEQAYGEAIRPR
jgi:glycosyltransferase involved in cell wall biosynthesis